MTIDLDVRVQCDDCGDYLNDGDHVYCSQCFYHTVESRTRLNYTRSLDAWINKYAKHFFDLGNDIIGVTNGQFFFASTIKELKLKSGFKPLEKIDFLLNSMIHKITATLWIKQCYSYQTFYARIFKDESGNQYHIDEKYYSLIPEDADYYIDSNKELSSVVIIVKGKYWGVVMPIRDVEANLLEVE